MSKNGVELLTPGALTRMSTGPSRALDVGEGRLERVRIGGVDRDADRRGSSRFERRDPGRAALGGSTEDRDRRAGVGQAVTDRAAEDAGATDDGSDASPQIEQVHRSSASVLLRWWAAARPGRTQSRRLATERPQYGPCGGLSKGLL